MSESRPSRWLPLWSALAVACAPLPEPGFPVGEMPLEGLRAPHGSPEEGFFVPWSEDPKTTGGMFRWLLTPNAYDRSGSPVIPRVDNDGATLAGRENSASLTWVGHATFAVHDGDDVLLTDPHFGDRALLPGRIGAPGIPVSAIPPDAFAVISHNHYDHLDADTVAELPESIHWYVPLGMAEWFRDRGRPKVTELDWWESARHGRFELTCLPSQHWSRRIEQGLNEALWCAWLVDSGAYRYFFAGDTGYFHGFREYGRIYPEIDVAMLPIGGYAPRWFMKWQHMDPEEAYQAFLDLEAQTMVGMHWGTFDLTDEPPDLPPEVLRQVVRDRGTDPERVLVLDVGERWHLPESRP